jgi:hypothetical protein
MKKGTARQPRMYPWSVLDSITSSQFWFLPFASMKQDYAFLDEMAEVMIGDWEIKLSCSNLTMAQTRCFLHHVHVLNVLLLFLMVSLYLRVGGRIGGGIGRLGGRFTALHAGAAPWRVCMVCVGNRSYPWRRCLSQKMDAIKTTHILLFVSIGCGIIPGLCIICPIAEYAEY